MVVCPVYQAVASATAPRRWIASVADEGPCSGLPCSLAVATPEGWVQVVYSKPFGAEQLPEDPDVYSLLSILVTIAFARHLLKLGVTPKDAIVALESGGLEWTDCYLNVSGVDAAAKRAQLFGLGLLYAFHDGCLISSIYQGTLLGVERAPTRGVYAANLDEPLSARQLFEQWQAAVNGLGWS